MSRYFAREKEIDCVLWYISFGFLPVLFPSCSQEECVLRTTWEQDWEQSGRKVRFSVETRGFVSGYI